MHISALHTLQISVRARLGLQNNHLKALGLVAPEYSPLSASLVVDRAGHALEHLAPDARVPLVYGFWRQGCLPLGLMVTHHGTSRPIEVWLSLTDAYTGETLARHRFIRKTRSHEHPEVQMLMGLYLPVDQSSEMIGRNAQLSFRVTLGDAQYEDSRRIVITQPEQGARA
ncbi:MAG: hypothetical protein ACE366_30210 [Bradymonadia bacterium]